MKNGGYHIVDLTGYNLSTTAQTIAGLNADIMKAATHGKPIYITGMRASTIVWDVWIPAAVRHTAAGALYLTGVSSTNTGNYIVTLYITAADAVTLTQVDVTNPTP